MASELFWVNEGVDKVGGKGRGDKTTKDEIDIHN